VTRGRFGEKIIFVSEEHRWVGIPALCLTEALRAVANDQEKVDRLGVLIGVANASVLPLAPETIEDCQDFAGYVDDLDGRHDLANAAHAADQIAEDQADELGVPDRVYVVTAEPSWYEFEDGPLTLDLFGDR
jgi:hypothetical protein